MSVVSLVRTPYSDEMIRNTVSKALALIDFKAKNSVTSVAIKPNLCYYWNAATGYTTDPRVVAAVIDYVRETYGNDVKIEIVEADATAMQTKYAFLMLGYNKLAQEKNVELFNLSNDTLEKREIQVNGQKLTFEVPKLLLDSDLFINVPKLKVMRETTITCAFKNIFGCIGFPRKVVYHPRLNEAIVAINKILHPHLTLVDGLVALGRFPVKLGLIMASVDPFSVDWVASQIMGYNPWNIKYLKIAMKEGIGSPKGITVQGESLETFKNVFPKVDSFASKLSWSLQLNLLKLYNKIVRDVVPDVLEGA